MAKEVIAVWDIDQFAVNNTGVPERSESLMLCGFITVATLAAGGKDVPLHDTAWIDTVADQWYSKYNGANIRSNDNGINVQELQEMIVGLGFHWQASSKDKIKAWIAAGYPCIVSVAESSVEWLGHGSPYPWDTKGLYHVFVVTQIDQNGIDWHVRDSANESLSGPYVYGSTGLEVTDVTVFVPSWLARPVGDTPPIAVIPPVPNVSVDYQGQQALAVWGASSQIGSGIFKNWFALFKRGLCVGRPTSEEFVTVDWNGKQIVMRLFGDVRCEYRLENGVTRWYGPYGEIK